MKQDAVGTSSAFLPDSAKEHQGLQTNNVRDSECGKRWLVKCPPPHRRKKQPAKRL